MRPTHDSIWETDRLATYARVDARLTEVLSDPHLEEDERQTQEMIYLWKLYDLSGRPFGGGVEAVRSWRQFFVMTTAS